MSTHLAHLAVIDLGGTMIGLFVIALGALTFIVHLFSAIAVYRDGHALRMRANAEQPGAPGTILVVPEIWAIATLIAGILMLAGYWILHHTALFARRPDFAVGAPAPGAPPIG